MKCKKMYLDSVKQLLIGKKKNRKIFLNDLTSWNLLNTLWWNKTVHDLHEIENWDNQIRPTIIIDNTEDSE